MKAYIIMVNEEFVSQYYFTSYPYAEEFLLGKGFEPYETFIKRDGKLVKGNKFVKIIEDKVLFDAEIIELTGGNL